MQQKFRDDPSKNKGIFGGNRSGKTEGVADYVARRCLDKPKQKWWVNGETFQDSVAIQQTKIWNLIPKSEIKYGKFNPITGFTNRKLLFKNGSLITFKSYDQGRESFQSDDIDGIWNDEEPPLDIYKEQRMRLVDRNGEMLISMTSLKGVTELIDDIFSDYEAHEMQHAPLVNEELPRIAEKNGMRFYFLWTTENPHIVQPRITEEAALMTHDEKKARLYGIPINLTGKIYMQMSRQIHVIRSITDMPEGNYTLTHVLDPHDRKPWAMIWLATHKTGSTYVVDEWPNQKYLDMKYDVNTYEEYRSIIRSKEKYLCELFGIRGIHRRILDPNFGNKTVQLARRQGGQASTTPKKELQKLGFMFRDGIDALEAGHLKVREALHYKRNEKTGEITSQPRLKFLESCHNTITSMLRYSRKDTATPSGDEKDKVAPMDKYKDHPDCVRYGVMSNLRYIPDDSPAEEFKRAY